MVGKVVSNKMQKTVVVAVERLVAHPVYKKQFRHTRKIKAHDEMGANESDIVKIVETKPISKDKAFKVVEIISRAKIQNLKAKSEKKSKTETVLEEKEQIS